MDADRDFAGFWEERARTFAKVDPEGWAAVCHRGAPSHFNAFIDWSQRQVVGRLLSRVEASPGDPAIDIGCGTGRWTRQLATRGFAARGFDMAPSMVERAREISPRLQFDVAPATRLPVPDASQQLACCVAVLHHLPKEEQPGAVSEVRRVLRPGGSLVLVVLRNTLPAGTWCFPRSRKGWRQLLAEHDMHAVIEAGQEFLTPALMLHWLAGGLAAERGGPSRGSQEAAEAGEGLASRCYRGLLRVAIAASYPLEGAASRWFPRAPAFGLGGVYVKRSVEG
jgi:SAM-dependent methyltransferase